MLFPLPVETDLPQSHHLDGNKKRKQKKEFANLKTQYQVAAFHEL